MTRLHHAARALAVAALAAAAPAAAQPAPRPAADTASRHFVVLLGADTLAVERYARTAGRLAGTLALRQQGVRIAYDMELGAAASATSVRLTVHQAGAAPDAPPVQEAAVRLAADSATITSGGVVRTIAAPAGTVPYVNLSSAVLEQLALRARAIGGDSAVVPMLVTAGMALTSVRVRWPAADSAVLAFGPAEIHLRMDAAGALERGWVPSQGVRFERAAGPVALAQAAPDYAAPPGAPYTAEEVRVRNEAGGVTLAGTLTVPRHAPGTRVPAVLLVTGSGPQDRDESNPALPGWRPFRQFADTLGRRGIAVLRLDDRGVGGSQAGPADATSETLAGDARAALAWLRARPDVDPARLAVLGHSEGGIIAPMVAATDDALRAIVLVAAPSRAGRVISDAQVAQLMDEQGIGGARRDSLLRANDRARDSVVATSPWMRFWMAYDPLPTARRVRQPVLVVQGATDRQVSADQAAELAAAIRAGGNGRVTVRVFPDVNHLLVHDPSGAFGGYARLPSYAVVPPVLGAVADWLAEVLGVEARGAG